VKSYSGCLQLASGNCLYSIDENGRELYSILKNDWKGVAISCRFKASQLSIDIDNAEDSPKLSYILRRLQEG
jgi:hypothetical protein